MNLATPDYFQKKNIDKNINSLEKKSYIPKELVEIVKIVCAVQMEALDRASFPDIKNNEFPADFKISNPAQHKTGAPILLRQDFPLDLKLAEGLVQELLLKLAAQAVDLKPLALELSAAFKEKKYSIKKACEELLKNPIMPGDLKNYSGYFKKWMDEHPESPYFFSFIMQSAILPSTIKVASLLAKKHESDKSWEHGHCPICGSLPFIGRISNKEGQRSHTCSFCFFEFRVPRVGCPFCLKESQGESSYMLTESEPGYQVHVCKDCKQYIKIADFREYQRIFNPMLDDLDSLILDLHTVQVGYIRPTLSAWGF